ncbi:hypothetical protein ABG79_02391 [Caloramator mitchellensis]|uniref:Lipoprotein n=1 Tax=Caloramator mitchellensis TaxID=908809 RepID=A0A0R3JQU9_CALMK|nr:hypothetical protein [Caloramator mitchellensis]KRQ85827.1 hypothetical protein ABG79_02391 [Caloramator mitchellensis]
MKRVFYLLITLLLLTSCQRVNPEIKNKLSSQKIERIVITNTRYAGRYSIIDKKAIARFKNKIIKAEEASINTNLEPDFIFDFYSENKKIASYKYIAELNENNTVNLYDESGKTYRIPTSIEDEFIKRLLKKDRNANVPDYYKDSINLILDKLNVKDKTIAIDLKKETMTLKYLTSVEIKEIFESINRDGIKINLLEQNSNFDVLISINTKKYSGNTVQSEITVTDSNGAKTIYFIEGNYKNKWDFFIKYK